MARLVVVVPGAQPVEVPRRGRTAIGDRDVVVDLEVPVDVTALDDAFLISFLDRGAQVRRDRAAQVGDGEDVDALVTITLRKASSLRRRATETGIGPTPAISHTSPGSACPLVKAEWSTRTTTVPLGPAFALASPARSSHIVTSASKASASGRSRAPESRAASLSSSARSAEGSADAASAISLAWTVESSPARSAASVSGSDSRRAAVSTTARAEPTVVPVVAASHPAAGRARPRLHRPGHRPGALIKRARARPWRTRGRRERRRP